MEICVLLPTCVTNELSQRLKLYVSAIRMHIQLPISEITLVRNWRKKTMQQSECSFRCQLVSTDRVPSGASMIATDPTAYWLSWRHWLPIVSPGMRAPFFLAQEGPLSYSSVEQLTRSRKTKNFPRRVRFVLQFQHFVLSRLRKRGVLENDIFR